MSTATIGSKRTSSATRVDLRSQVASVGRGWSTALHRLLGLVAELDGSGQWALDGARTCAHWVATVLDVEVATARERLRVGHSLERLGGIDAALGAGRISCSKARLLTRYATAASEAELLEIAQRTPAGRLAVEIARWLTGHETPEQTDERQHEARSLTWRTEAVLHVRGDGCTLDDGTPIAETFVERIAAESFIRVLIHDARRRPIDASGRHRHPTTRQKRVVHGRDR